MTIYFAIRGNHFHYDACELPPTNLTQYRRVITAFAKALQDRYGETELRTWKFEVYNEADLHWTWEQYASMYDAAAAALKSVDTKIQVGGPASAGAEWVGKLIQHCNKTGTPLDFVTTHAYPPETASVEAQLGLLREAQRNANLDGGKPLLITEWSSGATGWVKLEDGTKALSIHDDWQMAAWIFAAVLNATDTDGLSLSAYSYWAASDVFTEQGLPSRNISFSGNWGLVNIFGVRKPSFRAFQMLADAGSTRAALSLAGADTKNVYSVALLDGADLQSSSTLTILIANHACTHRCAAPKPLNLSLSLRGLASAPKSATVARINATSANPKARWESLGAPDFPSPREIASIHAASVVLESAAAVVERGSGIWAVTGVVLETYSLVSVKIRLQ